MTPAPFSDGGGATAPSGMTLRRPCRRRVAYEENDMRESRILTACLAAMALSVLAGCSLVMGNQNANLSENFAASDRKAVANVNEFNDGSRFTFANTRSELVESGDPNWMDAEKYSAATIVFPAPTPFNRIMFFSKDLDRKLSTGMVVTIDYLNDKDEWVELRRWDRNPIPRDPVISGKGIAKKLRLRIKRPPTLFSGGGGGGAAGGNKSADNGDRQIYEIEVYQYLPASPTPAK